MTPLTFDSPFCECADIHCSQHVPITWKRYKRLCGRDRSVVIPAHVLPGQRVIDRGKGYEVVDADEAIARRQATQEGRECSPG